MQMRLPAGSEPPTLDAQGKWLLDYERVMTSKDGDVFVFDVKGVHRGGMVSAGERRIIQVMMS